MTQSHIGPTSRDLDPDIVTKILARTSGRSRIVVEQILAKGFITTSELADLHGYDHAPRAARDVRDRGIPLLTVIRTIDGKRIGHYRFPDKVYLDRDSQGRITLSKRFRNEVIHECGTRDIFTGAMVSEQDLQVDHRIPYHIAGDPEPPFRAEDFMAVSSAMNRAKSWECEHCPNWEVRNVSTCMSCYWAYPDENYSHVATRPLRRADVVWIGKVQVESFDELRSWASAEGILVPEAIRRIIDQSLNQLSR